MEIERASSMIGALHCMSKTIVDDTLYEKVFSFLIQVLSNQPNALEQLNSNNQIFDQINKACLIEKDQDYRVITLCIRLLGQLVYYGKDPTMTQLVQIYPTLLQLVINGLNSSEPALRCACIGAIQNLITCHLGYNWLLETPKATQPVVNALLDQSAYVVDASCQCFASILLLNAPDTTKTLMEAMDPSQLVVCLLNKANEHKQIMSGLNFCWEIVNVKNENALNFLREKEILSTIIKLYKELDDRFVRARVVEVLSVLFSWDDDALTTLCLKMKDENEDTIAKAYVYMLNESVQIMKTATKVNSLSSGLSLLETTLELLKRVNSCSPIEMYSTLHDLYKVCIHIESVAFKNVKEILKSDKLKSNLLQQVLRIVSALVKIHPELIDNNDDFIDFFNVLNSETLYTNSRVLKESLLLLTNSLYSTTDAPTQQIILTKAIYSVIDIINGQAALDCKSLIIVLESFDNLLGHEKIGSFVIESSISSSLIEAINLKFYDTEWDVRDAIINFVGHLFKEPTVKTKIDFAIKFKLPSEVFDRIHDSEPYVRASAVQVLKSMMTCKQGWDYIQQHQVSRELAAKLPNLLYDTEAFVRRAALDAIICLVQNRSCQGMAVEIEEETNNQNILSPGTLRKLMNDQDSDVRIKTCTLIENLWILYQHEKSQQKKPDIGSHDEHARLLEHCKAGELLTEAAVDINRVVRIEALRVITSILDEYRPKQGKPTTSKKRSFGEQEPLNAFEIQFLDTLETVNITQQLDTLDPEHLYQEAFDINADMMTRSVIPTDPEDDANMLDCYN